MCRVARICALAPPRRRVDEGTAYKLTTVAGESLWVSLPDELARPSGVVAVPRVPIPVDAELTTAPAREAANWYCDDFPKCEVTVVDRVERMRRPRAPKAARGDKGRPSRQGRFSSGAA